MNPDDDSILSNLLHQLDLDSALFHLPRIGFCIVSSPCNKQAHHHLRRYKEANTSDEHEDILIQAIGHSHFRIKHAYKGRMVPHPDTITTWEEWVTFMRPLMAKGLKRMREISCGMEEAEDAIQRIKCAEQ